MNPLVPRGRGLRANLLAAVVLFVLGSFADLLRFTGGLDWRAFIGFGYAVAIGYRRGYALLPGICAGNAAVLAFVITRVPLTPGLVGLVLLVAPIRALLALTAGAWLRRYAGSELLLHLRGALAYLATAGVIAPVGAAALTFGWLVAVGQLPPRPPGLVFVDLILAGSAGTLLVAPLFLLPPLRLGPWPVRLEAIACGLSVIAASLYFFSPRGPGWFGQAPIHLLLPLLLWATLRFGLRGAVYSMAAVGSIWLLAPLFLAPAVDPTAHGRVRDLLVLQAATLLLVAVVLRERRQALDQAEQERGELEQRVEAHTAALRAERELNQLAIDVLGTMVMVLDPDGRFVRVNRAFEELTGWTLSSLAGKTALVIRPPEEHERARAALAQLRAGRPVESFDVQAIGPDGRRLHVEYSSAPIRDAEGRVRGILITGLDVTERVRALARREEVLSLLRATLEATADGILVVDRENRITAYNRRFAALWGIPEAVIASAKRADELISVVAARIVDPEAFRARVLWLRLHPEVEAETLVALEDGAEGRPTSDGPTRASGPGVPEPGGSSGRWFQEVTRPHRLDGRIIGRLYGYRDVTLRRRAEAERDRLLAEERRAKQASTRALREAREAILTRDRFLAEAATTLGEPHAELVRRCAALVALVEGAHEGPVSGPEVTAAIDEVLDAVTRFDRRIEERLSFLESSLTVV
jgi:PAS domain S-box-containing protein